MDPAIIVHGGCGYITPDDEKLLKEECLKASVIAGLKLMEEGGSSLDAVEVAVTVLEDSPLFNAGVGSALRSDCSVEMDALIMHGKDLKVGSVAAVKGVKNPVKLARLVMEKSEHVQLCGVGASNFSQKMGLEKVSDEVFKTPKQIRSLEKCLAIKSKQGGCDTVGAVAIDTNGCIACGTSTGGIIGALPGRVGDVPQIGSGGYADNSIGGVSTTGSGEDIARVVLARLILFHMEQGHTIQKSLEKSLHYMKEKTGTIIGGAIVIDKNGEIGMDFISPEMSWASLRAKIHWGMLATAKWRIRFLKGALKFGESRRQVEH
ncbi:isoaspartyl peptidase/L-asparaginase-like isoform X2 [Apostichopus japonicus]|uniref:isoaspartyl peptidase/L-asparaginase-like isoform X2 n=1 Tax=Stichopus japonicus TaxID=307972 RepID=UPI003AB13419